MDKKKLAEKLSSLIQDKDFVVKLAQTESDEEAKKLFAENGCELEIEKIKLIRDTLSALIKGEIEISEKDLENISGGADVNYKKVLAVALGATLVIGLGVAGVHALSGSKTPPAAVESATGQKFIRGASKVAGAVARAAAPVAEVAARPTWPQSFWGIFSKNQRIKNEAMRAGGKVVAYLAE